MNLSRRVAAEFLGTAMLLAAVVGSGIMGERLAGGNEAIALLANSLATGATLVALIVTLAPISGAHFNPLISIALAARGDLQWRDVPDYVAAQVVGAMAGVIAAHGMFGLPLIELSFKPRPGPNLVWSEVVATYGLLLVVLIGSRRDARAMPYAVAAYITAAYWFTASTSFANPAVTLARAFTDTFCGIAWPDVPGFLVGQVVGSALAAVSARLLLQRQD